MDVETNTRRQLIFDKIKERQNQQQTESKQAGSTYRSVVQEEELQIAVNFFGVFSQLFNRGRKLKPVIKERPSKNLEMVKECKLVVHVIKAVNVPIRHEMIEQYEN